MCYGLLLNICTEYAQFYARAAVVPTHKVVNDFSLQPSIKAVSQIPLLHKTDDISSHGGRIVFIGA